MLGITLMVSSMVPADAGWLSWGDHGAKKKTNDDAYFLKIQSVGNNGVNLLKNVVTLHIGEAMQNGQNIVKDLKSELVFFGILAGAGVIVPQKWFDTCKNRLETKEAKQQDNVSSTADTSTAYVAQLLVWFDQYIRQPARLLVSWICETRMIEPWLKDVKETMANLDRRWENVNVVEDGQGGSTGGGD